MAAENATKLGIEIHAVAIDDELIKPDVDQLLIIAQKPEVCFYPYYNMINHIIII